MSLNELPSDPGMLVSLINTRLRDEFPAGIEQLCEDMHIGREELVAKLAAAGFEYIPEINQFR